MKVSLTTNIFFKNLEPKFESFGFRLNKRRREFYRKDSFFTQILDLSFIGKKTHVLIKPEIRIKIEPIEEIYRNITSIENRPFFTLGNNLFEIVRYMENDDVSVKNLPEYWLVEDEEDLEKLTQVIPEYFEEFIIPYFEKNTSIDRVDFLLNQKPREISIHNWLYPLKANIGIIAAKLNGNNKLSQLIDIYEEELQEAEETYKEDFFKLKTIFSDENS